MQASTRVRRVAKWMAVGLMTSIAAIAPLIVNAAERHPAYQRARNELRTAQFFMRTPEVAEVVKNLLAADAEVELAVAEVDKAAIIDHRNLTDAPRLEENPDRRHRLAKIVALLREARKDMAHQEDNERARANKDAAVKHIDASLEAIRRIAIDLHWEKELHF